MNSKERVLTVIEHKIPDRVPVTNRFTPEIALELSNALGIDYKDSFDLEVELGHDLLCTKEVGIVNAFSIEGNKKIKDNQYICDFGIIKRKVNYNGGSYVEIVKNSLEDIDAFSSYKFPNPDSQPIL